MSEIVACMDDQINDVKKMLSETHPEDHLFVDHVTFPGACAICGWVSPEAKDSEGGSLRQNLQEVLAKMVEERNAYASGNAILSIPLDGGPARVERFKKPRHK